MLTAIPRARRVMASHDRSLGQGVDGQGGIDDDFPLVT